MISDVNSDPQVTYKHAVNGIYLNKFRNLFYCLFFSPILCKLYDCLKQNLWVGLWDL